MSEVNLLITTNSEPYKNIGGPGKFCPILFENLIDNNKNIKVFALMNFRLIKTKEEVNYRILEKSNSSFKMVKMNFKYFFIAYIKKITDKKRLSMIKEIVTNNCINVVHSHDFYMTYLFIKMREKYKVNLKIIFTNHYKGSLYEEHTKFQHKIFLRQKIRSHYKNIEKYAIKYCDCITFPSKGAMNLLINDYKELDSLIKNKTRIVYTGINRVNKISTEKDPNEILILNVANHIPSKGIINTLHIIEKLNKLFKSTGKKISFVNCGANDNCTEELLDYVRSKELEDVIKFKGLTSAKDIKYLLNRADLFILTPNVTVFDLVLLESMSVGLPIFTTKLQGNVEMLGDEYPLYASQDNDKNIKMIYEFLTSNKDSKEKISNYLLERYNSTFTTEKMIDEYEKLYTIY